MIYSATLLKRISCEERKQLVVDAIYHGLELSVRFEDYAVANELPVLDFTLTELQEGDQLTTIISFIKDFKSFTGSIINLMSFGNDAKRVVYTYEDDNGAHYLEAKISLDPVAEKEYSGAVLVTDSSVLSQTLANDYFDLLSISGANGMIISSVFSQYKILVEPRDVHDVKDNYQLFKYKRFNEFSSWLDSVISHSVKNNNMHFYVKMHAHDGEDSIYFEFILELAGSLTKSAADFAKKGVEDVTQPILDYSKLLQGPNTSYLTIFKQFDRSIKEVYEHTAFIETSSVKGF